LWSPEIKAWVSGELKIAVTLTSVKKQAEWERLLANAIEE
jgi:hypothetical protein